MNYGWLLMGVVIFVIGAKIWGRTRTGVEYEHADAALIIGLLLMGLVISAALFIGLIKAVKWAWYL